MCQPRSKNWKPAPGVTTQRHMPTESDKLITDLGALITASRALRLADQATKKALDEAVVAAGVAVSKTINGTDASAIAKAREAIDACRRLVKVLELDMARSRATREESARRRREKP